MFNIIRSSHANTTNIYQLNPHLYVQYHTLNPPHHNQNRKKLSDKNVSLTITINIKVST